MVVDTAGAIDEPLQIMAAKERKHLSTPVQIIIRLEQLQCPRRA